MIRLPIEGFPGYWAGDDGLIYCNRKIGNNQFSSIELSEEVRPLAERPTKDGRLYVCLPINGRYRNVSVHKLIATAFHGTCPSGLECSHLDGNPGNNRPENLRWESHIENCKRRLEQGSQTHGVQHGLSKLTSQDLHEIRALLTQGVNQRAIAAKYHISQGGVSRIKTGRTYIHE